jgi:hypothetical protein
MLPWRDSISRFRWEQAEKMAKVRELEQVFLAEPHGVFDGFLAFLGQGGGITDGVEAAAQGGEYVKARDIVAIAQSAYVVLQF